MPHPTAADLRRPRATVTTGAAGTGPMRERRLEDALQFAGLIAGQLAAGHFAIDEVVDLRLEIARRGPRAAGFIAGATRLYRRIDVGEGCGQRVLVGRTDRAGVHFRLQLVLQSLQWRLKAVDRGRRERGHVSSGRFELDAARLGLTILTRPFRVQARLLPSVAGAPSETFGNKNPSPGSAQQFLQRDHGRRRARNGARDERPSGRSADPR
jgi:hypothetical protein